ncbi:hypothetical protein V9T40_006574 [Parthenolecanium corni]|uniref:Uncharacterized protein n=1 Tax=Parthenolecanium corni TaxID=536013 RepID=A0AAN9Y5N2_9HEMI
MLKLARPFATLQHPSSFTAAVIFQKKKRKSLRAAKGSDVVCVYGFENKENCQPFSLRLAIVAFSNDTTASPPSLEIVITFDDFHSNGNALQGARDYGGWCLCAV